MIGIAVILAAFILGIIIGWEAKNNRVRHQQDFNDRYKSWRPTNRVIR